MREIFMNPSGFLLYPWMAVLVYSPTGVTYTHQIGGVSCRPRQIEGYYVPVYNQEAHDALRSIFEVTLGGSGTYLGVSWKEPLLGQLSEAVSGVRMDSSDNRLSEVPLSLDEARLDEIDEAWVPITSPDGPGILIWENSD
jgi:hypothetical protein